MILNDKEIIELCEKGMITPFENKQISKVDSKRKISFGVSSFGYDITLNNAVRVFRKPSFLERLFNLMKPVDPKDFTWDITEELKVNFDSRVNDFYVVLPPYSFALGSTVESFNVPDNIMCLCTCKSTYARIGLNLNSTTFEPEFKGEITLELYNQTHYPMRIYLKEGVAQVLFYQGNRPNITYADKEGKYQNQRGIQGAIA